ALISEEENKSENNGILDLINQERILKEFKDKLERIPYDSKANKLLELLEQIHDRNPTEKVLIFTQFIDTLFYLKDLLKKSNNSYHVEIFYGGMNKDQKDEAVERFKESNKFSIMLSTEIGGEGRNFQFCRILINYDLPWNPMRLEQRIGRLDRIGQKSKEIYIYNFFIDGTVETDIIYALDKRIHLFEESIGQLEPILGNIESEIKNIVFSLDRIEKIKKLRKFREKLDVEIRRAREMEMKLDDLLIDKKSFQAEGLFSALASCREVKLSYGELFLFIYHFFNQQIHDHGEFEFFSNINEDLPLLDKMDSIVWIKISDNLARNSYFKLKNIYIGTFSLSMAREREDLEFFALGHPLINHVINYCRSSYFNGDFTILKVKKSKLKDLSTKFSLEEKKFYLLIFKITFQGFIIENQYLAVIIDDEGNEIEEFSDIILDISYCPDLFSFDSINPNDLNLNIEFLEEIINKARNIVNYKTFQWKSEIKRLNDKIYNKEIEKREKIYQYKKKVLTSKLESLELKLSRKKRKLPTKRQMENINKIDDETKKIEKLNKIKELKENIKVIESDILKLEKKLDELEFEYMDLQKDMKKRNQKKFLIKLSSLAMVKLVD
ncbi:MAG: helicase-related protein, partial [Promethearchaeota archaeon]